MMPAPHERIIPGPAAAFAATLCAQVPVLETARLRLRAPQLDDFESWAEILTGPAGPWLGGPFDRDDAFTEFAAATGLWLLRGHGPWTVVRRSDETVLGFVLIGFEPGDREPELGVLMRPCGEGHGYAAEAAEAVRAHGFGAAALPSLVSYVDPENRRALQLFERLGARRDGTEAGAIVWRHERPAA